MLRLEDIKPGAIIQWLEPGEVVYFVASEPIGKHAFNVHYKKNAGVLLERMNYLTDEINFDYHFDPTDKRSERSDEDDF